MDIIPNAASRPKKQRVIGSTDYGSFKTQLEDFLNDGWKIVPGTIAIALTPSGLNLTSKERYLVVVEK